MTFNKQYKIGNEILIPYLQEGDTIYCLNQYGATVYKKIKDFDNIKSDKKIIEAIPMTSGIPSIVVPQQEKNILKADENLVVEKEVQKEVIETATVKPKKPRKKATKPVKKESNENNKSIEVDIISSKRKDNKKV